MAHERRSTVVPMDFEYTSEERRAPPAWTTDHDMDAFNNMNSNGNKPGFPSITRSTPTPFGVESPSDSPFLAQAPSSMNSPSTSFWKLPQLFSQEKTFSSPSAAPEVADVSMDDATTSPITNKILEENPREEKTLTRKDSQGAVRRVFRERHRAHSRRSKSRAITEEDSNQYDEFSTDEDQHAGPDSITSNHHYTFNIPSMPINRSEVPYMLLGYVQFLFNLSLVLVFLYIVIQFILTVQHDVEHRIKEYKTELAEHIATCAQLYDINKCFPLSGRVPAIAKHCLEWESCMQRDPNSVGRARVVAETIGEVVNSFVEPISWKTLIFGLISLGFIISFINLIFSTYRAKVAPTFPNPTSHPPQVAPVPYVATPMHPQLSHPYMNAGYGGTPMQAVDWSRTWNGADMSIPGTPTKRRLRHTSVEFGLKED